MIEAALAGLALSMQPAEAIRWGGGGGSGGGVCEFIPIAFCETTPGCTVDGTDCVAE